MVSNSGRVNGRSSSAQAVHIPEGQGRSTHRRPGARPRQVLSKSAAVRRSDIEHAAKKQRLLRKWLHLKLYLHTYRLPVASRRERHVLAELQLGSRASMDVDGNDDYDAAAMRGDVRMDISAAGEVHLGDRLAPHGLSEMYAAYLAKHRCVH